MDGGKVRCPRCGKWYPAITALCPDCMERLPYPGERCPPAPVPKWKASKRLQTLTFACALGGSMFLAAVAALTEISYFPGLTRQEAVSARSMDALILLMSWVFVLGAVRFTGDRRNACLGVLTAYGVLCTACVAALCLYAVRRDAAYADFRAGEPAEVRVSMDVSFSREGQVFAPLYTVRFRIDGQTCEKQKVISRRTGWHWWEHHTTTHTQYTTGDILYLDPGGTFAASVYSVHSGKMPDGSYAEQTGQADFPVSLTPDALRTGYRQEVRFPTEDGTECAVTITIARYLSFWEVVLS